MVDPRLNPKPFALPDDPIPRSRLRLDRRMFLLRGINVLAFGTLLAQLWRLQIVEGRDYRQLADINRFRVSPVASPRGVIYDRNQKMLAVNTPSFQVAIVPAGIPKDGAERIHAMLARLLSMKAPEIADRVNRRKGDDFTPVAIKSNVEKDIVLQVEEQHLKLPGVIIVPESSRLYPFGPLLSHIVGYTLPIQEDELAKLQEEHKEAGYRQDDRAGATGVEATYEKELRGRPGQKLYEVDATERPVNDLRIDGPDPGHNLTLAIDSDLQKDVQQILLEGMGKSESAVAIVMDPRDGQLLAMVSVPSYDDNIFSGTVRDSDLQPLLNDPRRPMFNYAVSGTFAPGSTFKLVTAAAALQEGIATAKTEIICEGALYIPNQYNPSVTQKLPCWGVHGRQNFIEGIANSCDVYFWTLAGGYKDFKGVGSDRLGEYARMMGYGAASGIDIPGEADGLVPTDAWKRKNWAEGWLTGDTYNMAIGQGFVLATPLQVANTTNAMANGGRLLAPRLVGAIGDSEDANTRPVEPVEIRRLALSPENLAVIRQGMIEVMRKEPVKSHDVPALKVAGKTGTAEFPGVKDEHGILPTHGWFTCFAPYDEPRFCVTVFLQRGGGPSDAVPVGMRIIKRLFNYVDPAPVKTPTPSVPTGTRQD